MPAQGFGIELFVKHELHIPAVGNQLGHFSCLLVFEMDKFRLRQPLRYRVTDNEYS
jgi:hypothetical protein